MAEYRLKISGVHYGANGDSVAGRKDTGEMHLRTRELLGWIERDRPIIMLSPDNANHIHPDAIKARARGRRIGRVALECVDLAWALLRQSGQSMIMAKVSDVAVKEHGYIIVVVDAEELKGVTTAAPEIEWQQWLNTVPLLPPSEQLEAELEAAFVLDNVYLPNIAEADTVDMKFYLDLWLDSSRHDLSREARLKRSEYIECLEAADDKDIRQWAEPLKQQRTSICGRTALDEHVTEWWTERLESSDMQRLWNQWRLKNDNKLWRGLSRIDDQLRQLPGKLYSDIGQLDIVLSRLYYMNTPRKAFQAIIALLMLRQLACRELDIEMRPMMEDEYQIDGLITNPMEIPTTVGRVVDFGKTRCDKAQQQVVERLVYWLRDDYERSHCQDIESMAEPDETIRTQTQLLKKIAEQPRTETINGDKYVMENGSMQYQMAIPQGADPAEIAARIAEQQQKSLQEQKDKQ